MKKILIILFCFFSAPLMCFPIPKDNEASFDVIRKNKIIGSVITTFNKNNDELILRTIVDIKVKVLFIPAYKFFQDTTETWINDEFIKIKGYTDFEDEREYYITGNDIGDNFVASGMDGDLVLSNKILPLNYWNKKILESEEVFDTQKGIVRKISVKKLDNEIIKINEKKIETEKYTLEASKNPKDLGPFPKYTLWYKNDELIKFEFINWKDNKKVSTIRNDL
tara:strand:+ start:303 stop:971 length:669 start_codon:yes stop_codon:yes gene_type:complete